MILVELHRGFVPERVREAVASTFRYLTWIEPDRADYLGAAELANLCRRHGVQLGSTDALIAQLAIRHDLTLLTIDKDFTHAAAHIPVRVWRP